MVPRGTSWFLGPGIDICRAGSVRARPLTGRRLALLPPGRVLVWERLLWGQDAVGKAKGAGPKGETLSAGATLLLT